MLCATPAWQWQLWASNVIYRNYYLNFGRAWIPLTDAHGTSAGIMGTRISNRSGHVLPLMKSVRDIVCMIRSQATNDDLATKDRMDRVENEPEKTCARDRFP